MKWGLPCAAVALIFATFAPANATGGDEPATPDAAVERASALVDQAERSVALARRAVWSDRDPGKLLAPRMSRADVERIEFYKQEARRARLALCQLLQAKRNQGIPDELTASFAAPVSRP